MECYGLQQDRLEALVSDTLAGRKLCSDFQFISGYAPQENKATGVVLLDGEKRYFKIQDRISQHSEDYFRSNVQKSIAYPEIIAVCDVGEGLSLSLYHFYDTRRRCGYEFLRSDVTPADKEFAVNRFFNLAANAIYRPTTAIGVDVPYNSKYFEDRILSRYRHYYYSSTSEISENINDIYGGDRASRLFRKIDQQFERFIGRKKTVYSLVHGDFHDINFDYSGVVWDLEAAGFSPILCDISVFSWFAAFQDDYLIPRYKRNFLDWNTEEPRKLDPQIDEMRMKIFANFSQELVSSVPHQIANDMREEFIARLLCRALLIENVGNYIPADTARILDVCDTLIEHGPQFDIGGIITLVHQKGREAKAIPDTNSSVLASSCPQAE